MALKPLACPNCHGTIENFDESMNKGICPFCDAVIVNVPELQQQFALDNEGRMKVAGIEGSDEQYNRIITFMNLGENGKAVELATEYANKHPGEFRAWKILCDLQLADAIVASEYSIERRNVASYVSHLVALSASADDAKYLSGLSDWLIQEKGKLEIDIRKLTQEHSSAKEAVEQSKKRLDIASSESQTASQARSSANSRDGGNMALWAAIIVGILWIFIFASQGLGFALGGAVIAAIVSAVIVSVVVSTLKKDADDTSKQASKKYQEMNNAHWAASNQLDSVSQTLRVKNATLAYIDTLLSTIGAH